MKTKLLLITIAAILLYDPVIAPLLAQDDENKERDRQPDG